MDAMSRPPTLGMACIVSVSADSIGDAIVPACQGPISAGRECDRVAGTKCGLAPGPANDQVPKMDEDDLGAGYDRQRMLIARYQIEALDRETMRPVKR